MCLLSSLLAALRIALQEEAEHGALLFLSRQGGRAPK